MAAWAWGQVAVVVTDGGEGHSLQVPLLREGAIHRGGRLGWGGSSYREGTPW